MTTRTRLIATLAAALALLAGPALARCAGENLFDRLSQQAPDAAAALRATAEQAPYAQGRVWRVEKDGAVSTIFGTFHVHDPDATAAMRRHAEAVTGARVVFLELTQADIQRMQAGLPTFQPSIVALDGTTLDDILTLEEVSVARQAFTGIGVPYASARRFQPWFAQVLLSQPPCALQTLRAGGVLMDHQIEDLARAAGAAVKPLEDWRDSLAAFAERPRDAQVAGLRAALEQITRAEAHWRTALELYLAGDIMLIWEYSRHISLQGGGPAAEDWLADFWDNAVVARNRGFLRSMRADLAQGGAFVAMGALHLPGEGGVLAMLAAEGFAITRIE